MTLSQDEREKLADKHGLKRSALRWAKGDTAEELEADILELLEDGFRADGSTPPAPPAPTPPTRTPREALTPSELELEPGRGPLTNDDLDRMLDDRAFDSDATRVAADVEGSLR